MEKQTKTEKWDYNWNTARTYEIGWQHTHRYVPTFVCKSD